MRIIITMLMALMVVACDATPEPDSAYCDRVNAYHATKHLDNPTGHKDYLNYCGTPTRVEPDPWSVEQHYKAHSGE